MILPLILAQSEGPDPRNLPIGRPGTVSVAVGEIRNTTTMGTASVVDIAKAAKGYRYVFVGESHDHPDHHKMQASVIDALVAQGRDVVVGFEMFTRPVQKSLAPWSLGRYTEPQFIVESDWQKQWGFPFEIYAPIFRTIQKSRLPMVALNVPRDWVRAVGKGGYEGLTAEQRQQLPAELYLGNKDHENVFVALMGGHPPTSANIYKAQVLWDEGMADTAIKYFENRAAGRNTVMVIIAGIGHGMYGQGINYRILRRTGEKTLTVAMVESGQPAKVSRGIGDFVYVAPTFERPKR
ncbi:MAG: ChaN family lipoprotein [Fimbriimonadaceae bacterium]